MDGYCAFLTLKPMANVLTENTIISLQYQTVEILGFKHSIQLKRNQMNYALYSASHVLFFTA